MPASSSAGLKLHKSKIGIGGPVGSGKTALAEALCRRLAPELDMAGITNDIYTKEDAALLLRRGALSARPGAGGAAGGGSLPARPGGAPCTPETVRRAP